MHAEDRGEPTKSGELRRIFRRELLPRPSHPQCVDLAAEALRRAPRAPQDALRARLRLDEGEDPLGHRLLAERIELGNAAAGLDVLGDLAQRELAQRGEVVLAEEVEQRLLGPAPGIDLAAPQTVLQRLGREIDEDDLVGVVQYVVRERLAHADTRQLEDCVVQALEVLDVDGRDDVDAGCEDLVDVLVALRVPRSRRVGVGELVDERELWRPPDDRVHVHLLDLERPVADAPPRHDLEPLGERRSCRAVVGLEVADHDVPALGLGLAALLEHAVGLADAGRHSQQDPVPAAHGKEPRRRTRCG